MVKYAKLLDFLKDNIHKEIVNLQYTINRDIFSLFKSF